MGPEIQGLKPAWGKTFNPPKLIFLQLGSCKTLDFLIHTIVPVQTYAYMGNDLHGLQPFMLFYMLLCKRSSVLGTLMSCCVIIILSSVVNYLSFNKH